MILAKIRKGTSGFFKIGDVPENCNRCTRGFEFLSDKLSEYHPHILHVLHEPQIKPVRTCLFHAGVVSLCNPTKVKVDS